jgi:hypothetical protein
VNAQPEPQAVFQLRHEVSADPCSGLNGVRHEKYNKFGDLYSAYLALLGSSICREQSVLPG